MSRSVWIAGAVIALAIAWYFSRARAVTAPLTAITTPQLTRADREKDIFQSPRPRSTATLEKHPCDSLWTHLRSLDLSSVFDGKTPLLTGLPTCHDVPTDLQEAHAHIATQCGLLERARRAPDTAPGIARERKTRSAGCFASLSVYRALLSDRETQAIPLAEIRDPKLLADKMLASWTRDPARAADAAERLLEVEPGLAPAARVVAMGHFLDARAAKDRGRDADWNRVEADLDRAKRLSPQDGKLYSEMEMAVAISRGTESADQLSDRAHRLEQENPESGLGPFFLAYLEQKRGNRHGAVAQLERAVAAAPDETRYQRALAALKNTPPGRYAGVFGLPIPFPIEAVPTR